MRQLLRTAIAFSVVLAVPLIAYGAATAPVAVKTTAADEFHPAAGNGYLVWTQAPGGKLRPATVWAQHGTEAPFRVSGRGINAYTGGIDGTRVVYVRIRRGRSDVRFFDLATRTYSTAPAGVNSRFSEFGPTLSGKWLLFGRYNGKRVSIVLFNMITRRRLILDSARFERGREVSPGQVNGNFAVWTKCMTGHICNVYRYDIAHSATVTIPSPLSRQQYGPSVTDSGTMYFVRSARGCGTSVELVKYTLAGASTIKYSLPQGLNVMHTYADTSSRIVPAGGSKPGPIDVTRVYFDRSPCRPMRSDVYRVDDIERPPPLR